MFLGSALRIALHPHSHPTHPDSIQNGGLPPGYRFFAVSNL